MRVAVNILLTVTETVTVISTDAAAAIIVRQTR